MFRVTYRLVFLVCVCAVSVFGQSSADYGIQWPSTPTIEPGSAADVSGLIERPVGAGRPAGIHGFLKTAQDRFEFEDGQGIRFWGLNWPPGQPMPVGEKAAELAHRLARQGFNLVRLPLPAAGDSSAAIAFEQFTSCLRGNGIYLDLLLDGDTNQIARVNAFTGVARRDDAGIALLEFPGAPSTAVAFNRRGWHQPVGVGPVRNAKEAAALQTTDFLSQTAEWGRGVPMVKCSGTVFGTMGFGAAANRPHLIGAWSAVAANPFRAELPLWTAAIAGFQRWAGVCVAGDAHATNLDATTPDIVTWAWAPACALMFQRGDTTPAKSRMLFRLASSDEWRAGDEPFAAAAGLGMARYTCEIAPTNTMGWLVLGGVGLPGIAAINPRISDTGEIVHDWRAGQVKIDSPRTQAVIGFFGNEFAETRDLRLTLTNGVFAAVALTSLDGEPLAKSQRWLLTATGRADPSGAPRLEPVAGEVTLRWLAPSQHDRKMFALDLNGHRQKEVPLTGNGFRLQPEMNAAWYEIIAEAALPKPAAGKEVKTDKKKSDE